MEIVSGDTVYGDTAGTAGSALWYSFIGTGDTVTASTCHSGTDLGFDSYLEIYSGTCNNLFYEFANDDDFSCPTSIFHSTVSGFETSAGVDYYLNARGFGSSEGAFELVFTMAAPTASPTTSAPTVSSASPTTGSPAPSASPTKAPKGSGGKNGGKQSGGGKQNDGGKQSGDGKQNGGGKQNKGSGKNRGLRIMMADENM